MKDFLRLISYLKPYKIYAVLNVVFNVLTILFSVFSLAMIIPFMKLLVGLDNLVTSAPAFNWYDYATYKPNLYYMMSKMIQDYGASKVLMYISLAVVVLFFFKNFFRYLAMYILAPLRNGVIRDVRNSLYTRLIILPLSFYSTRKKGDLIARATNDVQDLEWTILGSLEMAFRDVITIIAYLGILFFMSPQLTLIMLTVLPIAGFVIGRIGHSLRRKSHKAQTMNGTMMAYLEEAISGLRIIKGFNGIKYSQNKFYQHNDRYSRVMISVFRRSDLSAPLSEFFGAVVMAVVLWYGGNLILSGKTTMDGPEFIFYVSLFSQVIPSIKSLSSGFYRIQKGLASAQRIWEILDASEEITEAPDALPLRSFTEAVAYKEVSFKYEEEPVLERVSVHIPKGKMVALVGSSGAGKSTFLDLLPRFYDVVEGQISIDGVDIRKLKINDLRSLMGIVTQESILFNDTVFNNIAFGMEQADEQAVIAAAKVANAHDFIMELPEGYQTLIGDRGNKLSGGQKQRISIARAVMKNPPILILDEATSSLDTESEKLVQEALDNLMRNRTTIVVAHRLSTIRNANTIVVLDKGKVVEEGSHEELLKKQGIYFKLRNMQSLKGE